jgi:Golgi phosphoprotein 3 (GPP34)
VIGPLSKNLRRTLYERLAGAGVIRAKQGRTLGLFPTHRWPAQDTGHEGQVRQLVTQALVQQGAPDTRSAALIALLHALRCEHKIVDPQHYGLSKRQLRARAEEIATGNWASEAVRKAIEEIIAAVAATSAATAASAGSGQHHGHNDPRTRQPHHLRARPRQLALPGCRVMRPGCAVFVVRATGTCWHAAARQGPWPAAPATLVVNSCS